MRKAKDKKAKRAKIAKQLEAIGRRNLLDTRIVMKNSVYIVGMKIPGSGSPEEAVSILRSNEYFGQYGKIARLYLRDRSSISSPIPGPSPDDPSTSTGIYIVYIRREDAARAIAALDKIPAPQGQPGQLLHASYGTTRYCDAFLRGAKCDNQGCQNLHEWGGEGDSFTRSDLITALTRPAEYDARQKQQQMQPPPLTQKSAWPKPSSSDDADSNNALPRTASWGMRPAPARPGSANGGRIAPVGSSRPVSTKINSNLIPLGGRNSSAFPPPTPSPAPVVHTKVDKKKEKAQSMARARSGSSSVSSGVGVTSATGSPKKKAVTITMTQTAIGSAPKSSSSSTSTPAATVSTSAARAPSPAPATTTTTTAPPPPPGIAPPPGLAPPASTASTPSEPTSSPPSEPEVAPAKPKSPVKKASVSVSEREEEPEAGPSRQSSPIKRPASTEYPIHSPYPDFDDVFMQPDARKQGFEFSLGLDDDELQRLLAFAQEMGGFEPSPFDPLLEELPKLGIPLASLIAVPRAVEERNGPIVYTGPFSPFAPSSPVETSSLPTSEEPSAGTSSSDDADAPRTTSRFEFARRGSLASAGRGQSPFRAAREEWNGVPGAAHRAPSSNGYADDVPRHFHPALAHLNSHVHSHSQQGSGAGDQWSAGGSDYAGPTSYSSRVPYQHTGASGHHNYGNAAYGSPQREPMYSPASHVHPGYDYVSQHQQQGPPQSPMYAGGFMQRRF